MGFPTGDGQHKVQERIRGSHSKRWHDYKGLLDLGEKFQHGYQMTKQDLTTAPMNRKSLPLT